MDEVRWTERLDEPAEVRAYGHVFTYRHLGRGTPVLLFPPPDGSWRMSRELLDGLAGRFRLIVPDTRPAGADLTCWLACFLDGLGLRAVGVVADEIFRASVSDLVSRDPGQVGRVAVVVEGGGHGRRSGAAIGPESVPEDASILQIRRGDLVVPSTLPRLVRFLRESTLVSPLDRPPRAR